MAVVVVGMTVGLALASLVPRGALSPAVAPGGAAGICGDDAETLDIVADEAVVRIVEQLAARYTADLRASGRECTNISVRSVTASAVVGRLTNGWHEQTHGPRPDVWIPKSTLWVELLRAQLVDGEMLPEDPTVLARSPTVMAVPLPMARKLGWPDERLSWGDFFDLADADDAWGDVGESGWGPFQLEVTDPRFTTTGLQALLALDRARDDTLEPGTPLSLFRVQRVLADIDSTSSETLTRYADADAPLRTLSAMALEEREVWRFNETGEPSAATSPDPSTPTPEQGDRPELVAMYPSGGGNIAMESDYPYVVLNASWVQRSVLQVADEFGDYLTSDAGVQMFTSAGFRTRDNRPGEVLRTEECMQAMDQVGAGPPGELPEVGAFRKLRSSWLTVPRISRTLFLLDVSTSMQAPDAALARTRLEAAVSATEKSLDIIPNGSDVGLWEFSTDQADGGFREVTPVAPLSQVRDGTSHEDDLATALDSVVPGGDVPVNDALVAAYEGLRKDYVKGQRHLIVVLTDGSANPGRTANRAMMRQLRRLHEPQEPIQVVSIAFGEADTDRLRRISNVTGGRVVPAPQLRNLGRQIIEALAR